MCTLPKAQASCKWAKAPAAVLSEHDVGAMRARTWRLYAAAAIVASVALAALFAVAAVARLGRRAHEEMLL